MKTATLIAWLRWLFAWALAAAVSGHAAIVAGAATEVGHDIIHPNGNTYDQVLLTGVGATVEADPGQVVRISFIDLNDDIVQCEFSGKGSLTISLAFPSGPAVAAKYNQPGVQYMRGHATITIQGSDATTNVSAFSVGPCNAVNQALFPAGTSYDGTAGVAAIRIVADPSSLISTFGGIRTGNVNYFGTAGTVGIAAVGVNVQGPVIIGDLTAFDDALPTLSFGLGSQFNTLTVAGGDLFQPNERHIVVSGFSGFNMAAGATSGCGTLSAQPNRGTFSDLSGQPVPPPIHGASAEVIPVSPVAPDISVAPTD